MKRYRMLDQPAEMDEYPEGDYVKFKDVELLLAVVDAAQAVAEICLRPGMEDPFHGSWKWLYRLQEALKALDAAQKEST